MRLNGSPPENQVNYQDSVDLFDSLTGGGEQRRKMPSLRPSLTSRTKTGMLLIWLPSWATDGYRPATRQDFR